MSGANGEEAFHSVVNKIYGTLTAKKIFPETFSTKQSAAKSKLQVAQDMDTQLDDSSVTIAKQDGMKNYFFLKLHF